METIKRASQSGKKLIVLSCLIGLCFALIGCSSSTATQPQETPTESLATFQKSTGAIDYQISEGWEEVSGDTQNIFYTDEGTIIVGHTLEQDSTEIFAQALAGTRLDAQVYQIAEETEDVEIGGVVGTKQMVDGTEGQLFKLPANGEVYYIIFLNNEASDQELSNNALDLILESVMISQIIELPAETETETEAETEADPEQS